MRWPTLKQVEITRRTAAIAFWIVAAGMGAVRFDFGRRFGTFARESTILLQKTYRDEAFVNSFD